ncbi:hypothetical protein FAES_1244 [Fibrella aestuarina BUZ 2]|uniref:Uncharacterized protein n=2 Tax=Fibrella TaxID=861914 RepID=I0K551_9BACT|nr:hypothetical protein FAES_1244 [Fibrella aestuarina BUZ 2]
MVPTVGSPKYPISTMPLLEAALMQAWQGSYAAWYQVRKQAITDDLGQDPTNRLLLLLGEEITSTSRFTPEQQALDAYLFSTVQGPIANNQWAVADGTAPLIGHFASRRTRGHLQYDTYEKPLIEGALAYLSTALDAATIDLSLATGLTGKLLSVGSVYDNELFDNFSHPVMPEIDRLLRQYIRLLQQSRLPIDASLEQFVQFPNLISKTDNLWEEPEHGGWAEGDLGQAMLLAQCGRWLNQPDLLKWAIRVAAYTIHRRKIGQMQIDTPGIRYGMAGMMRLYQRVYELTGEPTIELEAQLWRQQLHTLLPTLEGATAPDYSLFDGLLGLYGAMQTRYDGSDLPLRSLLL